MSDTKTELYNNLSIKALSTNEIFFPDSFACLLSSVCFQNTKLGMRATPSMQNLAGSFGTIVDCQNECLPDPTCVGFDFNLCVASGVGSLVCLIRLKKASDNDSFPRRLCTVPNKYQFCGNCCDGWACVLRLRDNAERVNQRRRICVPFVYTIETCTFRSD